jgi:hypothetical protein
MDVPQKCTENYQNGLSSIPASGGGGAHQSLLSLATLARFAGVEYSFFESDIKAVWHGNRRVTNREIFDAYAKAEADYPVLGVDPNYVPKPKPPPEPKVEIDKIFWERISVLGYEMMDLVEMSPVRLTDDPDMDYRVLMHHCYKPEEYLFVGDTYSTEVHPVSSWLSLPKTIENPYIIINPLTGEAVQSGTDKMGNPKFSKRCDKTVAKYRFYMMEFDEISIEDQVNFWCRQIQKQVPVVAVIHSGSKSLHGWIAVKGVNSYEDWSKNIIEKLYRKAFKRLGVDTACQNPSRLSRLPGHHREGKQQQRLLYLNPEVISW